MLLLEMVGGRKNIDVTMEKTSQVYFPKWVYNQLDMGEEVCIQIEEEEDIKIAKKLTIYGTLVDSMVSNRSLLYKS